MYALQILNAKSVVVGIYMLISFVSCFRIHQESSRQEGEHIEKRSAATTVEFSMNSDARNQLLQNSALQEVEPTEAKDLLCPQEVSTDINDPINKRSLCPWYYKVSYDARRFPAYINNASQLCDYAIGSNSLYECVPVTQSMLILKQELDLDEAGSFVWVESTVTVIVGYTAAGRRFAHNSDSTTTNTTTTTTTTTTSSQGTPEWAR